jgi:hypothetical protein
MNLIFKDCRNIECDNYSNKVIKKHDDVLIAIDEMSSFPSTFNLDFAHLNTEKIHLT